VFVPGFSIEVTLCGERSVRVCVHGDLDLACAGALRDALEAQLAAGRHVMLDLSGVGFIDPAGLGGVVRILEATRTGGGSLRVDGELSEPVRHLGDLTQTLDRLMLSRAA
jgi:anti-anti-sigma factor